MRRAVERWPFEEPYPDRALRSPPRSQVRRLLLPERTRRGPFAGAKDVATLRWFPIQSLRLSHRQLLAEELTLQGTQDVLRPNTIEELELSLPISGAVSTSLIRVKSLFLGYDQLQLLKLSYAGVSLNGDGYLVYQMGYWNPRKRAVFSLSFLTFSPDGLLFFIGKDVSTHSSSCGTIS